MRRIFFRLRYAALDCFYVGALRYACPAKPVDSGSKNLAKQLYSLAKEAMLDVKFELQKNSRHQFPKEMYTLAELL